MNNRRLVGILIFGIFLTSLFPINTKAQNITSEMALRQAQVVVDDYFPMEWQSSINSISVRTQNDQNLPFYVCDIANKGFILIRKNSQKPEVIGFSFDGSFPANPADLPDPLKSFLGSIADSKTVEDESSKSQDSKNADIGRLKTGQADNLKSLFVPPLLTTKWKVDSSFCAEFPEGSINNASAVIAMGQVFRYYETPKVGDGMYCYPYGSGQDDLCTDFIFEFNFEDMPDSDANLQVTKLLNYMAMAGKMQPDGDGANLNTYIETMPAHFFYSENMRKIEYWKHDFVPLLKQQLALNRPVPAEWEGHSFVIDGYYDTDFFHFNFGLGGEMDGFYFLNYSKLTTDKDHLLLNCFINYHPKSLLPGPQNFTMTPAGDSLFVTWNIDIPDSLAGSFNRHILLQDGVIPVLETSTNTIMVHPNDIGISSIIYCVSVYDNYGASELSNPFKFISDFNLADIPSLELRQAINIQLGFTDDLNRIPYVGELEMVKKIYIDFQDQRGIDKLTQLRSLEIDGLLINGLIDGEYLGGLNNVMFHRCKQFDFTVFENTGSLAKIRGSDGLPYDFYTLRHNSNATVITFSNHDEMINNMGDLYGADKYFKNLTYFDLAHVTYLSFDSCYISYESYNDILPNITGSAPALEHTSPSSFVPCYPSPVRNSNVTDIGQISWQSNYNEEPNVYYNVYIGKTRDQLALIAPFITTNTYDYNFENNQHYYWRVESFHNDTTYYSGVYHFSTMESIPMPFDENFDDYYSKCDVSFESPWWNDFGEEKPEQVLTNREIKRSGRYSLEILPNSDGGVIFPPNSDSAYQIEFYFQNDGAELGIEFLQGSNIGDSLVINSEITLFGNSLGNFNAGGESGQFIFNPGVWNHAKIMLDMPSGRGSLMVNDEQVTEWNWNVQLDGVGNTNPFRGLRFNNQASSGTGFIDDLYVDFNKTTGIDNITYDKLELLYSANNHELIISDGNSEIEAIELYDLRGQKIITFAHHGEHRVKLDNNIHNGVFIMMIRKKDGEIISDKISIQR